MHEIDTVLKNYKKSHTTSEQFVEEFKSCYNFNFRIGQICSLGHSSDNFDWFYGGVYNDLNKEVNFILFFFYL